MSWQELAYAIDDYETLISFVLLCISVAVFNISSLNVALFVWVLANFIMENMAKMIMDLANVDVVLSRQLWYLSFVVVNTLSIVSIYYLHRYFKLHFKNFAFFILTSFLLLSFIQLARYVDRLILETNLLASFYRYSVLTLNMAPMVIMIALTAGSLIIFLWNKRNFS